MTDDPRDAQYAAEREQLALAIHKRVNSSSIARTMPYLLGDADRAVTAVIAEGLDTTRGLRDERGVLIMAVKLAWDDDRQGYRTWTDRASRSVDGGQLAEYASRAYRQPSGMKSQADGSIVFVHGVDEPIDWT